LLHAQADEANRLRLLPKYEALMNGLAADEMVLSFSDAVHPEHQSRPAHGLVSQGTKDGLERRHQAESGSTNSGRA